MSDRSDLSIINEALTLASANCRYHGTDFEYLGMQFGEPRCESCRQPWRVARARRALERLWQAQPLPPAGTSEVFDGR